jgi:ketopantoate hydroxymethyltransferase
VLSTHIVAQSQSLFGTTLSDIQKACRDFSSAPSFGAVSRDFFAHLFSRVVKFVADKEVSNYVGEGHGLQSSGDVLRLHDGIGVFCHESARIVEEYAGGWFSKHNWDTRSDIPESDAQGFTSYAFEKLLMELQGAGK